MIQFDKTVSPDDHMMTADLDAYFRTSQSALDCVLVGLMAAGRTPETVASVLDFGSGYGRVYRALAAQFPQAKLTALDLMEPAARFCADTFGGDWVKSTEELERLRLPRKYDLVWLGSVFTHLPEHRWHMLLDFLATNVLAGGTVVFTSHGEHAIHHIQNYVLKRNRHLIDAEWFADMKHSLPQAGFAFIANAGGNYRHQKARGIDVTEGEYGFSFATEQWIRALILKKPEWSLVKYSAPGWAGNHDAVTLQRA